MKRYITLALCALTVFGLGSCNKVHEEDIDSAIRTVTFQAQMGGDTRTGLALKFVPDWRETNLSDVHIYEIDGDERIEGEDIEMTIPGESEGNYEIALFKADFSNMTIIVNPPSNAPRTRASEEVFQYTAVVASQDAGKKFTVPATQYPATATLIDPHADFIVGTSVQDFNESQAGKQVNLKFVRPVAVSRLSIMNVEDATIKQVKIYSSDKLTGSAAYGDVDFANGTVAFDNSGSNVLTLDYGTGVAMPAEGIFNAYFVSLTGTKRITKIEVVTNAQTLTKEFEGGKALTFKVPDFKSIAVNMAGTGSVEPGPGDPLPQNISFNKDGSAIEADSFDLYTGGTYVSPTVAGAATGATLSFTSSDEAVATVSSTGVVTPQGVGETTISVVASAVEGYLAGQAEYVLTVTDSTPEAVDQPLKFMKGGSEITADEYDLYNGGTYASPTLTGVAEGATVTWEALFTPEGCATMTAEGVVTPVAEGVVVVTATASAVAPLYKATTKSYTLTIKDTTPVVGPTVTINLEEATELVAGEKYVLVSNGFALVRDGENASTAAFDATAETVAVPVDLQENFEWTLEKKSGSITRGNEYVFTQEGGYFFGIAMNTSQQTYTYTVEVNNGRNVSTNISIQDHNISLANDLIYYAGNSSNYYVFYNTASGIWDNEKVGNTASPAATSSTALYKVKDERAEQNPQFSAATAEYDLYSKTWTVALPTLSGAQGAVTYTSSDETVAQVDNTGAVTIMTTAKSGDTATITAKAAGNDAYKPSGEVSYTISIVNNNPNVSRYNKVTSVGDLEVGAKYLIVFEGLSGDTDGDGDPKVFDPVLNSDGTQFAKATSSAKEVAIASGVIESSEVVDYEFTLEDGYYLKADKAAKYLYPGTSGSSSVLLAESTASHALAITFNDGIAQISNGTGNNIRYVVWSTSSHYFSCNQQVSGSYSTGICLYKLDDGRQAQEISFSAADAEYDLGTSTWTKAVPTLTGTPQGDVTYSSSDETVATVANDGTVTPLKKGTATITAKAAGNATYKPASASYELNVVNSNVPTYVKADEVESGKAYLIVSNGNVLVNNNGSAAVEAVTVSGGQIKYDAPDAALWTATVSSGSITFANGTRTLGRSSSNISLSASASFSYDSENEYLTTKSSSTSSNTYYLYCTTSFRYSQNTAQNAALYVLDDGRQAQEISFSAADAEYDLYTQTWTVARPSLSGAQGDVTYSSSDETVATVTNTGDVTPIKVGTTTITAKAAGNATYKPGQASYTVTVVDTTPAASKTYTRISYATGITTGKYLIVNPADAYVFTTSAGTTNAESVTTTGGAISGDYSSYELTITKDGNNYTIQNGAGQYLYYNYNQGDQRVGYQTTVNNWTLSAGSDASDTNAFRFTSSNQNIYWNNTYFRIGGSGTTGVHLYKLSDGTTPDPGPEPTTPSYTKVTSITSGATYLIVSADAGNYNGADGTKAFTGDQNGTAATVNNAAGVITGDYSAYEFVISASGSDYTLLGPNGYVTGNANSGTRYIQVSSTAGTMSLSMASDFTGTDGQVADAFYFYYSKTSGSSTSKEVLYYNADEAFKIGGTGRKYGVYLYKKN